MAPFYSVLIRANPENPASTTDFVCDVCTEIPGPSDGGRTYAFPIRDDVRFEDGSVLTAYDVAASRNKIVDPTEGVISARTQWDEFLKEGERGYLVLGCMDRDHAFAIPTDVFCPLMEDLNTTRNEDGTYYWHIQLTEDASGDLSLIVPKRKNNPPLSKYRLKLHA